MSVMLELDQIEVAALRRLLNLVSQGRDGDQAADPERIADGLTVEELETLASIAAVFDLHARQENT